MATRSVNFAPGEFYHVYNRGTDKRIIFSDKSDQDKFLERLYVCNSAQSLDIREVRRTHKDIYTYDRKETLVSIGAYCLMPNHFHLLITPHSDTSLSTFMNKLGTSYTMYFNKRNERTGTLFESTYKAKHANSDNYLKYLYAYIHLNPTKLYITKDNQNVNEVFDRISHYPYSSLPDYLGISRPENNILSPETFPEYFASHTDIKADLREWINTDEYKG